MSFQAADDLKTYFSQHEKYDLQHVLHKSPSGEYKTAAVAVDSVVASQVGNSILEKNGSVVDAAIASLLCNGLLNSQSMGIGGGFFMLHYSKKEEKVTVIDARETAPLNSAQCMINNHSIQHGGLSIAVPGEIKGYWKAHQLFGTLSWSELFEPAIEMCYNGYQLPHAQHKFLKIYGNHAKHNHEWRETFINEIKNEIYKANMLMKRPKLGKTFEIISRDGESAIYNGVLTDVIVDEVRDNGGIITKQDLNEYKVLIKEPIEFHLKNGFDLYSVPPPSCGILFNFILAIMQDFNFNSNTLDHLRSTTLFYHRFIEASKFAFGLRQYICDENFNSTGTSFIKNLLKNTELIDEYRSKIHDDRVHSPGYYGSNNFVNDNGTAHVSIIGPNGDCVAVTSSINHAFGSKIIGTKTNIHYNNQMDDFSLPDSINAFGLKSCVNNYIEPGKRPVSSMVPCIALDEDKNVKLVLGGSGGTRILTSCASVAIRNLLLDNPILQCVDGHRIHHQLDPNEAFYEDGLNTEIVNRLSYLGHQMTNHGAGGSAVQAIERRNGLLYAVCDKRKGGVPYGF